MSRSFRGSAALLAAALLAGAAGLPARAELLSKRFLFKPGTVLQVGESTSDGLRLDEVRFIVDRGSQTAELRLGGPLAAEVAISNTSERSQRVGIAVALFDDAGRLLGVASAGNKIGVIKAGQQSRFRLSFDDVNLEAHRATAFQISLESKP